MKKFLTIFPQESLECSFDQIFDKVLPEVWEILFHFLELFICFLTFFLTYDLIDHENFLSKSYSGHRKCNVDKTAEKKLCWKSKNCLAQSHKTLVERFWTKIVFSLNFPLDN